MRKNLGAKTYLYPLPVLIIGTYDEEGNPDAMNAAWGGISDYNQIVLSLASEHKTTKNIRSKKAFTVSFGTEEHLIGEDYVGIVSGNEVKDKFVKAGFHVLASEFVDAPLIAELPMALECRLVKESEDGLFFGEIVNVSVDASFIDENGKIDPSKMGFISYDPVNHDYLRVGGVAGKAFFEGKKRK